MEFLGFIIRVNGIKIDPNKTNAISDWPILKNVKEVQSFLGLANYNRKFIKDYSKIAIPLTQLTAKDTTFKWTSECQSAFDTLKKATVSGQALRMFDGERPIQVKTDASDRAIGACLT